MMARTINSYRDLVVWNEAMDLAVAAYKLSSQLPRDEALGLCSPIRRSAGLISANIAEGQDRNSKGAYVQQLRVDQGSLKELKTHLLLLERVGFISATAIAPLLEKSDHVGKMLRSHQSC